MYRENYDFLIKEFTAQMEERMTKLCSTKCETYEQYLSLFVEINTMARMIGNLADLRKKAEALEDEF